MTAPICAVLALLSCVAITHRLVPSPAATAAIGVAATAGLLLVARRSGLTWAQVGVGRGSLRRGGRDALVCVLLVGAAYVVLVVLPWTRPLFQDPRYRFEVGQALVYVLVAVPLRTVLLEEVAFRGVLWALVRRARGPTLATAASSALFGLWHLLSAWSFAGANPLVGDRGVPAGSVVGASVVLTAAAGVVLCELRRRSGSLLPPVALHWAVNGLGVVTTALVTAAGA